MKKNGNVLFFNEEETKYVRPIYNALVNVDSFQSIAAIRGMFNDAKRDRYNPLIKKWIIEQREKVHILKNDGYYMCTTSKGGIVAITGKIAKNLYNEIFE